MADDTSTTPEASATDAANPSDARQDAPQQADALAEMQRALRKANKEAETHRLRLKEIEDRDKTEAQKLAERAEAAEKRIADLQRQANRTAAARAAGLSAEDEEFLTGSTPEELQEQAVKLAARISAAQQPRVPAPFAAQGTSEGGPKMSPGEFMNHQLRVATGRTPA